MACYGHGRWASITIVMIVLQSSILLSSGFYGAKNKPSTDFLRVSRLRIEHPLAGPLEPRKQRCVANSAVSKAAGGVSELVREVYSLPTGLDMEVVSVPGAKTGSGKLPPLLFIHGSFHSSWCWAEHFLPFFASNGFDTYAISCRGTSRSPSPGGDGPTITIGTHVDDLAAFMRLRFGGAPVKPVVFGHSFGGSIVMKLLERDPSVVSGVGFMCSVPPSGNQAMTGRFLKRDFWLALKIVAGFVLKKAADWPWLAKELFFESTLDDETLGRYVSYLKVDSVVTLDVKDFLGELPSFKADPVTGLAPWADTVRTKLVLGASNDKIVDAEGVQECAGFVGVPAKFIPYSHDVMVGPGWRLAADYILEQLTR